MRLEGWHIVIIIVLAIVLFGAPKLPGLARSVGQSLRIFKSEVKQMKDENNTAESDTAPVEGRVVNNPAPSTYDPTFQTPRQHPGQEPPHYQGKGSVDGHPDGRSEGHTQAGPSQQSGTSNTKL
ncbi:sec-independent protein translocase protein TatA [Arthrobacter sp. PL16]|uniref:Sec-independent protein translocase subunit TatA n=1 Tax=Arthrobacter sp. PL16 TaxID=3071720 RepID=UPI002E0A74C2|nr:sec-independent protein translocase protein TatA [Arthrobacter sp. PL16]